MNSKILFSLEPKHNAMVRIAEAEAGGSVRLGADLNDCGRKDTAEQSIYLTVGHEARRCRKMLLHS